MARARSFASATVARDASSAASRSAFESDFEPASSASASARFSAARRIASASCDCASSRYFWVSPVAAWWRSRCSFSSASRRVLSSRSRSSLACSSSAASVVRVSSVSWASWARTVSVSAASSARWRSMSRARSVVCCSTSCARFARVSDYLGFERGPGLSGLLLQRGVGVGDVALEVGAGLGRLGLHRGELLGDLLGGGVAVGGDLGVRGGPRRGDLGEHRAALGVDLRLELLAGGLGAGLDPGAGGLGLVRELGLRRGHLVGELLAHGCHLALERLALLGHLGLELCAAGLELASEVGAALFEIAGKVGPQRRILVLVVRATELGLAGELGGRLAGVRLLLGRGRLQLGGVPLGVSAQRRDLALDRCARLCGLGGDGAADRGGFALGVLQQGVGGCLRRGREFGGGGFGFGDRASGVVLSVIQHRLGLGCGVAAQLGDLGVDLCAQLVGIDVGLAHESRRLLLGDAQHVLEAGAEAGVGGAAGLVELGLEVFCDGLEALGFLGGVGLVGVGLDQFAAQLLDGACRRHPSCTRGVRSRNRSRRLPFHAPQSLRRTLRV